MNVGSLLFRFRLAVILGFFGLSAGFGMAMHVESPSRFFLVTGPFCIAAFLLRAAGEARLGIVVYGQGAAPRVVTSGPFRFMRHPLYAGTWLFFVAAVAPYLHAVVLAALAVVFAACLRAIAVHEEGALALSLGDAWSRYAAAVPRFLGIPKTVERDDVIVTAWAAAVLSNLGMLSLGVYRVLVGAGLGFRGLASLNLLCLTLWLGVVVVRRLRNS